MSDEQDTTIEGLLDLAPDMYRWALVELLCERAALRGRCEAQEQWIEWYKAAYNQMEERLYGKK